LLLPAAQLYQPAELTVRGLRDLLKAAGSAEAAPEAVTTYMEPERGAAGELIDPLVDATRISGEKRVDISSLRGGLGHPPARHLGHQRLPAELYPDRPDLGLLRHRLRLQAAAGRALANQWRQLDRGADERSVSAGDCVVGRQSLEPPAKPTSAASS
jgi:hypothetical protein